MLCMFPDAQPNVERCAKFLAMTAAEMVKLVGSRSRCWLCLGYGHNTVDCTSGIVCEMWETHARFTAPWHSEPMPPSHQR